MIIQFQECRFAEIFGGNARDKDSGSLDRCYMGGCDKVMLTSSDEMGHLVFDVVPNPNLGACQPQARM